ncbi:MAG: bifunctional ornithine acetyltransferase/N-acetylglutamate synthase [Halobacteriota archaeon]|nr:bifunctional ornithine acetyltransferase/N-acetylglutamate synthase [Halobacteriota archaeon]
MGIKQIEGGICAVEGVKAWGIKEGGKGLALIVGSGNAVGVFTENKIRAAPLIVTKDNLNSGRISSIIVNSGNANSYTGTKGIMNAKYMAKMVGDALSIDPESVAVASTGIIGKQLDIPLIERQFKELLPKLEKTPVASDASAKAIMTTDNMKKEVAIELDNVHIGAIAKGSGMIEPRMGTMLAFIYTDAKIDTNTLKKCLKSAVDKSFNMVVVDGDTSTNDMALLIATGRNGDIEESIFQKGLDFVCTRLARMIAKDGEGATKLITSRVTGAKSEEDARNVAKAIVRSNLVKCAIYGENANWGRVICAIGNASADIDPNKIYLRIGNGEELIGFVEGGTIIEMRSSETINRVMKGKTILIGVDLGMGKSSAVAWGCDMTDEYVRINAEYST